jgi:pimeloyl-ACP methyl ester carboxylesterase
VSRIGINAECPNLLIRQRLAETIDNAYQSTGRQIHLVGHSLGGMLALAAAAQWPERVASVITLGTPFGGLSVHPSVARTIEVVRRHILERHGDGVLPDCYTGSCSCSFLTSLRLDLPSSVRQTAIYSKSDGLVEWQVCATGDPAIDVEVSATHIGMAFSPIVYSLVAHRLAGK